MRVLFKKYFKPITLFFVVTILGFTISRVTSFIQDQKSYARVNEAFLEKHIAIKTQLALKGIDTNKFDLYIRAFKTEQIMEIWARNDANSAYINIFNYPICSTVGQLGPKRKQGDLQIPEGFYALSEFNPVSEHHLSLKLDYPNKADSILGEKGNLGGQIYIHGGCQTIGCLPITNDRMKELYVLAVMARSGGQDYIPIHVFPIRLNFPNYKMLTETTQDKVNYRFWGSLRTCYLFFEERGDLPLISVNEKGEYEFRIKQ